MVPPAEIAALCRANDEEWILGHSWFVANDYEYLMNEDKTAFVLYRSTTLTIPVKTPGQKRGKWFIDEPETSLEIHQRTEVELPVIFIEFCLTDKAHRGLGHFTAMLETLQQMGAPLALESKTENLGCWYKRSFAVVVKLNRFGQQTYILHWRARRILA